MNFEELFLSRLPTKPYCTDNFKTKGLLIKYKSEAIKHSHIQVPNSPISTTTLVFDVDSTDSADIWKTTNLAEPTWISINPKTKHAHLGYMLKIPVYKGQNVSKKPIAYMKAITNCYAEALKADKQYASLITKNPFHKNWQTIISGNLYTLGDLAEHVDLKKSKNISNATIEGRNCTLFRELRIYAYSVYNKNNIEDFKDLLQIRANEINSTFMPALEANEIKSITKSVCQWTIKNYTVEKFREYQRNVRLYVGKKTKERIEAFENEPIESIADMLNISTRTVYRHKKKEKTEKPWITLGISKSTYYRKQLNNIHENI
jgi:hypothetical protein